MNNIYPRSKSDRIFVFWIRALYTHLEYGNVWVIYTDDKNISMIERAKYNGILAEKLNERI